MLIVQMTDLHCRPRGLPAQRVVESNMLAERALRAVERLDPPADLVLITGDLADLGEPGTYSMLGEMIARQLHVPVFAIPGNHDDRDAMIEHFPGLRHEGGFVQYTIDDMPVRIVMLDTLVPGAAHGELCDARLEWLEATLARAPRRPTMIAMHHPPFVCGISHMDTINLRAAERFVAVIARHRQVERIICGHHHRAITARVGHAIASIAPSVAHQVDLDLRPGASTAFVLEPPAFDVHRWTEQDGIVTHTAYVEEYPGPFPFLS